MDIHRCRFVPYPPSAINALAFSHTSVAGKKGPSPRDLRLALGRANGDIEIWNPLRGDWFQEAILRGGKDRSIEGLAWTKDVESSDEEEGSASKEGRLRLFSIGNSTSVTEWDLSLGVPARHAHGNFGDLWCLAAQPGATPSRDKSNPAVDKSTAQPSQYLAAGCSDGTIVLFSTEDNDLRFLRTIGKPPTKKPRVLSITWKDRNILVAGYDDSTIRIYDVRSRTTLRNMSLGKPGDGRNDIYVWAVRCLRNGTIISGDSTGELKLWDANNYSLVQRIQAHEADILDIATNAGGDMIVTGGADRRTVAYRLFGPQKGQKGQRWAQIMHRRFHQHDVKAIGSFESRELSILVSGGLDTTPIVIPFREWQNEYHRSLSNLPQRSQICSSQKARLMLTWWDRELSIWHISKPQHSNDTPEGSINEGQNHGLAAKILLSVDENITSAHISDDGALVAVSTVAGVKVFQLRKRKDGGSVMVRTRQIELPTAVGKFGAKLVRFSPDTHWLCVVRLNDVLAMAKVVPPASPRERPSVFKQLVKLTRSSRNRQVSGATGLGDYLARICSLEFSRDSRILAVGDLCGYVHTWLLEGYEDTMQGPPTTNEVEHDNSSDDSSDISSTDEEEDEITVVQGQKWIRNPALSTLPQLDSASLVLSFRPQDDHSSPQLTNGNIGLHATRHNPHPHSHNLPTNEAKLIVITASHKIIEFDVLGGKMSDWSRRNPADYLPDTFKVIKDRTIGCFWGFGSHRDRLWLYGSTWLFMLDLSQDLPSQRMVGRLGRYEVLEPLNNIQKKRKRPVQDALGTVKRNTGAGDAIDDSEAYIGIGQGMLKFQGGTPTDAQVVEMGGPSSPMSHDEEESVPRNATLALLRRQNYDKDRMAASDDVTKPLVNGSAEHNDGAQSLAVSKSNSTRPRGWWYTFAYRSILGIVPIGQAPDQVDEGRSDQSTAGGNMEVAIVERPPWDVDLPPRYDGGQDWEA